MERSNRKIIFGLRFGSMFFLLSSLLLFVSMTLTGCSSEDDDEFVFTSPTWWTSFLSVCPPTERLEPLDAGHRSDGRCDGSRPLPQPLQEQLHLRPPDGGSAGLYSVIVHMGGQVVVSAEDFNASGFIFEACFLLSGGLLWLGGFFFLSPAGGGSSQRACWSSPEHPAFLQTSECDGAVAFPHGFSRCRNVLNVVF